MNFKTVLILFIIAAALGSYIYFFESKELTTYEKIEFNKKIVKHSAGDLSSVTLLNKIKLRKVNNEWIIVSPFKCEVDKDNVESLVSELLKLKNTRKIDIEDGNLEKYGIDLKSDTFIKISADGDGYTFYTGNNSALDRGTYLWYKEKNELYLCNSITNIYSYTFFKLRDKFLVKIKNDDVRKIVYSNKNEKVELILKEDKWFINKPRNIKAGWYEVQELINSVVNLKAKTFFDNIEESELNSRFRSPELILDIQTENEKINLNFAANKDDSSVIYCRINNSRCCFVSKDDIKLFFNKYYKLKDKSLVDFNDTDLLNISIVGRTASFEVINSSGELKIQGMDEISDTFRMTLKEFVNELKYSQVTEYLTDNPQKILEYNLNNPQFKLIISTFNTKKVLLISKLSDKHYCGMYADEIFIFELKNDIMEKIKNVYNALLNI